MGCLKGILSYNGGISQKLDRNSCDYDDFFIVSKQDAEEQYQKAEEMLDVVKKYIQESRIKVQ